MGTGSGQHAKMKRHVSPSQIQTFRRCKRKWAYSRVRPRTTSPAAEFGTRAHTVAEAWLGKGTAPDPGTPEGRTIISGLHLLPTPGVAEVEREFRFTCDGVEFLGMIDFLYGYDPGRCVVVGDHKTTGQRRNIKSRADLELDPQRIIYSAWAAAHYKVDLVIAQWVYYLRATGRTHPYAEAVVFSEARDVIFGRFRAILEEAREITSRQGRPPEESPQSPEACADYGGCPYKQECWAGMSAADIQNEMTLVAISALTKA